MGLSIWARLNMMLWTVTARRSGVSILIKNALIFADQFQGMARIMLAMKTQIVSTVLQKWNAWTEIVTVGRAAKINVFNKNNMPTSRSSKQRKRATVYESILI